MKNLHFAFLAAVFLFSAKADAQYRPPELTDPESWSLVLVPDPQTYTRFHQNMGILSLMTGWIHENVDALNTRFVLCTGDLVEHNDFMNPRGNQGNRNSAQQWTTVRDAFALLDHRVPYVLATGNHDFGHRSGEYRSTQYDAYFNVNQNSLNRRALREIGPQLNGKSTSVNALYAFKTHPDREILVLVLEFAPRDTVVAWAKQVVESEPYADKDVILLTHVFLNKDSQRIKTQNYKIKDANYGEALFEKLVKPAKNIRLVFSGHIGAPNDFDAHLGFRQDKNAAGKTVTQMTSATAGTAGCAIWNSCPMEKPSR